MKASVSQKPVVLYVGPKAFYLQAHITGAENIGPVGSRKVWRSCAPAPHRCRDQGLQVIGVSVEYDAGELRAFYRKYKMNYPVVPSDLKIADGFGGVLGLPTTFLIGKDNLIHGKHNGATDFSALEQEVVALLHAPQS